MSSRTYARSAAALGASLVIAASLVSAVAASSSAAPALNPSWAIAPNGAGAGNVDANGDGVIDPFMSVAQTTTGPADANVSTDNVQPWTPSAFAAPTSYTIQAQAYPDCTGVSATFEWAVNGTVDGTQTGCMATLTVPASGATIDVNDTTDTQQTSFVAAPKNYWIVSLGDSFASGEGSPDTCIADSLNPGVATATACLQTNDGMNTNLVGQTVKIASAQKTYDPRNNKYGSQNDTVFRTTPGDKTLTAGTRTVTVPGDRWIWQGATNDQPCDRSTWAASAQAAMTLEQSDPHTSITYLQLACSGAQMGTGLIYPYKGYSQLAKLSEAIKASGRKPSQVVVSAGGNDAQLVGMLFDCFTDKDCTRPTSAATAKLKLATASLSYWISGTAACMTKTTTCAWQNAPKHPKAKATGLKGLGLNPKTITVLSYADPTRANALTKKQPPTNDFVHQRYLPVSLVTYNISAKELLWAYKNVMGGGLTPLMAKTWRKYGITWVDRNSNWGQHGLALSPSLLFPENNLLAPASMRVDGSAFGQRWFYGLETGSLNLMATNSGAPGGIGHPTAGGLYWGYRPSILAASKKLGIN